MLRQPIERPITKHHHTIEVIPKREQLGVVGRPAVQVEIFPKSPVIPIAAPNRDHGFVRAKSIVVVHPFVGALQSLSVSASADVRIERCNGVDVQIGRVVVGLLLRQASVRLVVQTSRQKKERKAKKEKKLVHLSAFRTVHSPP